ncbi:hypothetical protein PROFUN_16451 [Planoprotostelium fungivorum]|uniref:Uncharacterized protein n=1 Tax=Planoprotostelium fungivorum TaxID=1890364 RepID=A0A2P6MQJ5_9EUKA|nr:hypothetical protein PROFUN_16451 [Planoprotostelium fungivorum]
MYYSALALHLRIVSALLSVYSISISLHKTWKCDNLELTKLHQISFIVVFWQECSFQKLEQIRRHKARNLYTLPACLLNHKVPGVRAVLRNLRFGIYRNISKDIPVRTFSLSTDHAQIFGPYCAVSLKTCLERLQIFGFEFVSSTVHSPETTLELSQVIMVQFTYGNTTANIANGPNVVALVAARFQLDVNQIIMIDDGVNAVQLDNNNGRPALAGPYTVSGKITQHLANTVLNFTGSLNAAALATLTAAQTGPAANTNINSVSDRSRTCWSFDKPS